MKIFHTNALPKIMDAELQQNIYNAYDSLMTHEIHGAIIGQLRPDSTQLIYDYERKLVGPVMTMVRRGILIDHESAKKLVYGDDSSGKKGLKERAYFLGGMERIEKKGKFSWKVTNKNAVLQQLATAVGLEEVNYHSERQLKDLFYKALHIPPITIVKKGVAKVSCGREALEKMHGSYVRAYPFTTIIMRLRDMEKQVEVLTRGLSPLGRWAAGYNIAGTDTGRWSSSDNPLRHSSNIQNIDPELRQIFVPDPGYVLVQCDQQGAEARAVAFLSGDERYINAVESGDVHTFVSSLTWGFDPIRALADRLFYRDKSYRDMAKKLTHGTSYYGTPRTLATNAKCEIKLAEDFQAKFFKAFPGIRAWQMHIITTIQKQGYLLTPFCMRRQFWSRLSDDSTWRAAIAFVPQHIVGYLTGIAIYKMWYYLEPRIQLLANGHDAVIFQVPKETLDTDIASVLKLLKIPIPITDIHGKTREMIIPWDASIGGNWGKFDKDNPLKNPEGQKGYKPK